MFLGFSFIIIFHLSYLKNYFATLANYFYLSSFFFFILLGSAGMKLIFLIIFHVMLFFRFVTKPVLIIQECFSCCWTLLARYQDTVFFILFLPTYRLEVGFLINLHTNFILLWLQCYIHLYKKTLAYLALIQITIY